MKHEKCFKNHLSLLCSVTNYFLVNLSFADLLVTLICMPMAVGTNVSKLWIYGEVMCMLTTYFQGVSVSASVFTITAMSIDRYLAIRHPMAFRKVFNRKSTIFGSRLVRERRRVARILLVLAILFAMCWLPYNVIMLVLDLLDSSDNVQWLIDVTARFELAPVQPAPPLRAATIRITALTDDATC
ncbi:hypothetical protein FOCC_FOCC004823 [Frankliniella occidentalis]|nr:hypothetical protein FOCC_FOCC004823 [Frankliniella occidentalis]